jgi:hypothetical protein
MSATLRIGSALLAVVASATWPALAQSAGAVKGTARACTLLTDAEVQKLINRGQQAYGEPTGLTLGADTDTACEYPIGAQIVLFSGPGSADRFDVFLKRFSKDQVPRHPVADIGDRAFIMFPPPRDKDEDRLAYLVGYVGQNTFAVSMAAREGQAGSPMLQYCKTGQLSKQECAELEKDKGETPESLQPAVEEVARAVVPKLR